MLTPLDIENKKFSKQMMNGYSVEEVDEFLDDLTVDYEKTYKQNTELKNNHGYDKANACGKVGITIQGATTLFLANMKRIIKLNEEKKKNIEG